jgi:hypothetical protein
MNKVTGERRRERTNVRIDPMVSCSFPCFVKYRNSFSFSCESVLKIEAIGVDVKRLGIGGLPSIEQYGLLAGQFNINAKWFRVRVAKTAMTIILAPTGTYSGTSVVTSSIDAEDTEKVPEGITIRHEIDGMPRKFRWLRMSALVPIIHSEEQGKKGRRAHTRTILVPIVTQSVRGDSVRQRLFLPLPRRTGHNDGDITVVGHPIIRANMLAICYFCAQTNRCWFCGDSECMTFDG